MSHPHIFIDLDGTLVDLENGFLKRFNVPLYTVNENDKCWEMVSTDHDFFFYLEPFVGAVEFFNAVVQRYGQNNVSILTAAPALCFVPAVRAKRRWVRHYLNSEVSFIPVRGGINKAAYMYNDGDILIDDWPSYVEAWNQWGGRGILHKNYFNSKIAIIEHLETK